MSNLRALPEIISSGVDKIESACAAAGEVYPTLDDPYTAENNSAQNKYAADAAPIIAAAYQLIATLSNPNLYLITWSFASFFSASIASVGAGCVPDILRGAGTDGMHVKEIAAGSNMDAGKLGRILRLLASRHIFSELSPDVFCNNRISTALCIGKSVGEIQEKPLEKWDRTNGISAIVELLSPTGRRYMAPAPLVPYPDTAAGSYGYFAGMMMMGALNARERTLAQFRAQFHEAGWKPERVHRFVTPHPQQLVCSPM